MPAYTMINGVWRESWTNHTNINGVWRENNNYITMNSIPRLVHRHELTADDIIGFRIVYKLSYTKTHPNYPRLSFNNDLPVKIGLTGYTPSVMDNSEKGVIYEYSNKDSYLEGIKMYEGTLYAVLTNNSLVDVGATIDYTGSDQKIPGVSSVIPEAWSTNRIANLPIQINGHIAYEDNGYFIDGWNSLFTKVNFLDDSSFPDKDYKSKRYVVHKHLVLPISARGDNFNQVAQIGIIRDMKTSVNNMVGSYGILDHTYTSITVNGIEKPFMIEIYDY